MTRSSRRRKTRSGQYPLATLAPYGPDNTLATKLVASVVEGPDEDPSATRTWITIAVDVRKDPTIGADVADFLREQGVKQTIAADRIMGCPHQEGIDYPMGRTCPRCPFWAGIDRFTHESIRPPTPTMSTEQILDILAADDDRRVEALTSADGRREALTEPLLAALDRGLANPAGASDADVNLFSYAVYLFAKWREPRAYPPVIRWLSMPGERAFDIGGDLVTQDGARILAAVSDGDLTSIKRLILDRAANEYGRGAGVSALALLAAWAELPREPIVEHLLWLAREGLERQPSQVWDSLALACVEIEALEVFPELRRASEEGLLDPQFVEPEELDEVEAAPRGRRLDETRETAPPIADVAEATGWWDRGGNPYDDDEDIEDGAWDTDEFEVTEPYVAPAKVGRNAPCPCGSGKKYKKCCGL